MEEIKNEMNEETNMTFEHDDNGANVGCDHESEEKGGVLAVGLGLAVAGAAVAGAVFLFKKGKDKLEKHNIEHLRKKGYTVEAPVVDDEPIDVEAEVVDEPKKKK